jgi:hypothetical protein
VVEAGDALLRCTTDAEGSDDDRDVADDVDRVDVGLDVHVVVAGALRVPRADLVVTP